MSKYYTPSTEEFHVGFEYEALWGIEGLDGEWLKETFSKDQSILSLEDTVRVKHLDQEDIECFGWEKNRLNDRYYNPVTKMHMIHQGTRVAIFYQDLHGDVPKFDGVINNKSEFKKLLKQLRLI